MDVAQVSDADLIASLPRGVRSNNPLNLKGSDGQFRSFPTMQDGMAAADANLLAYHTKHGINTVQGVVSRWAPQSDGNDPHAYAQHVASRLGVAPDQPIDMVDPHTRQALVGAMGEFENGTPVTAPASGLSSVSDADLMASLGPAQQGRPAPVVTAEVVGHPEFGQGAAYKKPPAPQPVPNQTADVLNSGVRGLAHSVAGMADNVWSGAMGAPLNILRGAASLASGEIPHAASPGAGFSRLVGQAAPKTTAGRVAQTVGEMLPAAALGGGGLMQRAANVVLPTIGSEGAAHAVKALGGGQGAQDIARTVGGVAGGMATGLRLNAPSGVRPPAARSLEEMQAAKNAAYHAVDNLGVSYPRPAVNGMVRGLRDLLAGEGGAEVYPQAGVMLRRIQRSASQGPMTLSTLDKLRSQVSEVVGSSDAERRLAGLMRNHMDAFIDGASPSAPSGVDAAQAIREARALNTQWAKMREVSDRLGSGELQAATTNSGGNVNNNIRQKLRPLIDPKSPQRLRNLTPDERAALNSAVRGTPMNNAARGMGNVLRNRIVQAALAVPTHGASLALEIPGQVLKGVADSGTRSRVQGLLDLMSHGGAQPARRGLIGHSAQFPALAAGLPGLSTLMAAVPAYAAPDRPRTPSGRQKPKSR